MIVAAGAGDRRSLERLVRRGLVICGGESRRSDETVYKGPIGRPSKSLRHSSKAYRPPKILCKLEATTTTARDDDLCFSFSLWLCCV
ncbi:Os01g0135000 [Oryza sativa Japonica Group]|uniref:Os01g0135000 protein n=2 Tax=Oryza sativa subsp. japonica TaxID=39947 RepID=Q0JQW6_ORYSJ|nr:Os01g0135000 [Oryza sativa Japonica Group]BAS70255.1 Os01g0135000 [Oryza sativa Japonica Group]|eukprot:NP_001041948.1 Os01g0135000 [Oryza sativa Japonica Group]